MHVRSAALHLRSAMSKSRRVRAASALAACLFVALVLTPHPAAAAPTVIGFDDAPSGTAVGERYAALGVHFGPSPFGGVSGDATADVRAQARSAPNVAALAYDVMNDFSSTWIKFDKQQSRVDLFACRTGGPGAPATPNVNVDAYDANGTMVANLQGIPCTLNGPLVPVRIEAAHISYVNVAGVGGSAASGSGWVLDDLSFDVDPAPQDPPPPPPPPPAPVAPDFSLNFLEGPTTPAVLAVRPGASATRPLVVGRNDTSSGPIALSVSGLPPGVTANFDVPTRTRTAHSS